MESLNKRIKKAGNAAFLEDLKQCREIMVRVSGGWFHLKKSEVKDLATRRKIDYKVTDEIFVQKRYSMVLI